MRVAPPLVAASLVLLALSGCTVPAPDPPGDPSGDTDSAASGTGSGAGSGTGSVDAADVDAGDGSVPDAAAFRAAHESGWLCRSPVAVDDLNTSASGGLTCSVSLSFTDTHAVVTATGVPHRDLQSGPGCCTSAQGFTWRLPLQPDFSDAPRSAYLRGPVAVAANGVAVYGPEDGPGGDAVAHHEGVYEETRQAIWLGLCHGHAGPGGQYHYHADANCMHWHPGAGEDWTDYDWDDLDPAEHTGIVGWAFDGFPIQGLGEPDDGAEGGAREATSSYRLRSGATGYGGVADYEYVQGLGDLDACNGHVGPTPEFPHGVYHYHAVRVNGDGELGFPYFLACYAGVVEEANTAYGSTDETGGAAGGQQPPEGGMEPPPEGGQRPPPDGRPPPPGGGQPPPP